MNKLKTILLVSIFALTAGAGAVQAALVDFTLTGTVGTADAGNGFGLNINDSITVTGIFDDSVLAGTGAEGVVFSAVSGNSLNISAGLVSFTEADDVDYSLGSSPTLNFVDGSFAGFDYAANFGAYGFFNSTGLSIDSGDNNPFPGTKFVTGTWTDYSVSAVPVPAAVWLFGSGLLGLAGVARRKS